MDEIIKIKVYGIRKERAKDESLGTTFKEREKKKLKRTSRKEFQTCKKENQGSVVSQKSREREMVDNQIFTGIKCYRSQNKN